VTWQTLCIERDELWKILGRFIRDQGSSNDILFEIPVISCFIPPFFSLFPFGLQCVTLFFRAFFLTFPFHVFHITCVMAMFYSTNTPKTVSGINNNQTALHRVQVVFVVIPKL